MEGKQERFKTVFLSIHATILLYLSSIAMTAEIGTPMLLVLYKLIYCMFCVGRYLKNEIFML